MTRKRHKNTKKAVKISEQKYYHKKAPKNSSKKKTLITN